jgi:hypothetical protein
MGVLAHVGLRYANPTYRVTTHFLMQLASKYIWWKTADQAVAMPERVMAQ